jgi:hypothetical protein
MSKKNKKIHWKNSWKSEKDELPVEGFLVMTHKSDNIPSTLNPPDININQWADGDWFHKDKKPGDTWWRVFTLEDLDYFQDLAVKVFINNLLKGNGQTFKSIYGISLEEIRSKLCS